MTGIFVGDVIEVTETVGWKAKTRKIKVQVTGFTTDRDGKLRDIIGYHVSKSGNPVSRKSYPVSWSKNGTIDETKEK